MTNRFRMRTVAVARSAELLARLGEAGVVIRSEPADLHRELTDESTLRVVVEAGVFDQQTFMVSSTRSA
jgi:hypothetical protein